MAHDIFGNAVDDYFSNVPELNPCEDQWAAGLHNDPYPVSDQPYDCGAAYFEGWNDAASHSGHDASHDTSHDVGLDNGMAGGDGW